MHNLKTNFDKIYRIVKSSLSDKLDTNDNLQFYPRLPQMNDCSIISFSICCIDSLPVPICKIAREKRCKFGRETFEAAPDKGYSAVSKSYFYGYKLHLVTSVTGVFTAWI